MSEHRMTRQKTSKHKKENRQQKPLVQQAVSSDTLLRAIETPSPATLTPDVVTKLQEDYGNQFVMRLVNQSQAQQTPYQVIQTKRPDVIQRGPFSWWKKRKEKKKYKPMVDQSEIETGPLVEDEMGTNSLGDTSALSSGITTGFATYNVYGLSQNIKKISENPMEATNDEADSSIGLLEKATEVLNNSLGDSTVSTVTEFIPLVKQALKVANDVRTTRTKYLQWKIFDHSAQDLKEFVANEIETDSETVPLLQGIQTSEVGEASSYAAAKTWRGFLTQLFRLVMDVGRLIGDVVALFTAGVGELISLSLALVKGAEKAFRNLKGFWKWLTGQRGKNREHYANTVVNSAIKGEDDALQLMVGLNLFGGKWQGLMFKKFHNDNSTEATVLQTSPKDVESMAQFLVAAQRKGIIKSVKKEVFSAMASQ